MCISSSVYNGILSISFIIAYLRMKKTILAKFGNTMQDLLSQIQLFVSVMIFISVTWTLYCIGEPFYSYIDGNVTRLLLELILPLSDYILILPILFMHHHNFRLRTEIS